MIRPILIELSLFLTPFAIYAVFLWFTKSWFLDREHWPPKTLATLAIVALILVIGGFLYLSHFAGVPPDGTYVPAHMENGKFVPGRVAP